MVPQGRTRTGTGFTPMDFESIVSTNFTTPAHELVRPHRAAARIHRSGAGFHKSIRRVVQFPSMNAADFSYELPPELIAQEPLAEREASRLLYVPAAGNYRELSFAAVGTLLRPNDLLVLNDTRVIPGRLHGQKASGGKVEMLLERMLEPDLALVQLRASRPPASRRPAALRGRNRGGAGGTA